MILAHGSDVQVEYDPPSNGRRYHFDMVVTMRSPATGAIVKQIHADIKDQSTAWRRLYHRLFTRDTRASDSTWRRLLGRPWWRR